MTPVEHQRTWCAVAIGDRWVTLEPVGGDGATMHAGTGRSLLPVTFVILTAANPGGLRLDAAENLERHRRLLQHIDGIEPWTYEPAVFPAAIGAPGAPTHPDLWEDRTDAVALPISREEAGVIADAFGQATFYSFEHDERLVIGTGEHGVELVQRIHTHIPTAP